MKVTYENVMIHGENFPVRIERRKNLRRLTLRYDWEHSSFLYRVPYQLSSNEAKERFHSLLEKYLSSLGNEKNLRPYHGDRVYLFGEEVLITGWSLMSDKARFLFLKEKLHHYLEEKLPYWEQEFQSKNHPFEINYYPSYYGQNRGKGNLLRFSIMLVHYHPRIIDSVIAHEITHDFISNHSKDFYSLLLTHFPDYSLRDHELRTNQYKGENYGTN